MKKRLVIWVFAITLLGAAHRLPAPIVEEPTPAPSVTARPKGSPSSKKPAQEHKRDVAEKKIFPLAGTWEGTVTFSCPEGGGSWPSLTVTVAPDGNIVQTKWLTDFANTGGPFSSRANGNGSAIGWNCVGQDNASHEKYTYTFTLQRVTSSTATVTVHSLASGGTCEGRAVLKKQ